MPLLLWRPAALAPPSAQPGPAALPPDPPRPTPLRRLPAPPPPATPASSPLAPDPRRPLHLPSRASRSGRCRPSCHRIYAGPACLGPSPRRHTPAPRAPSPPSLPRARQPLAGTSSPEPCPSCTASTLKPLHNSRAPPSLLPSRSAPIAGSLTSPCPWRHWSCVEPIFLGPSPCRPRLPRPLWPLLHRRPRRIEPPTPPPPLL